MRRKEHANAKKILSRRLESYEIFIFWLAALAFWDTLFSSSLFDLSNICYLTFPATAWTTIELIKRNGKFDQLSLDDFLGRRLSRREVVTVISFTPVVIAVGVGSWALLVLIGAEINPDRTYQVWHLMMPSDFQKIEWSYSWLTIHLICATIVAPIIEEIIFRGVVLRALLKKYSVTSAIICTSLLFAFFHLDKSYLSAFIQSVIFSVVAIRFRSLYAPMLIHGLYNLIVTILKVSLGLSLLADKSRFSSALYWLPELALLLAALLACVIYAIYTYRTRGTAATSAIKSNQFAIEPSRSLGIGHSNNIASLSPNSESPSGRFVEQPSTSVPPPEPTLL
jgi:membrane protease YdiL (CAAX protease family)